MPKTEEKYLKDFLNIVNKEHYILIDMTSNIQEQINSILNDPNIHIIRKRGQEHAKKYLNSKTLFQEIFKKIL